MKKQTKNTDLIAQVLRLNDLDPTLITRKWRQDIELGGIDGVIAVVVLGRSHAYAVINLPVLVFSSRQAPMPVGAALQLVLCLPEISGARFAASGRALTLFYCNRIQLAAEEEVQKHLAELQAAARETRLQLLTALKHFYPEAYEQEEVSRTPVLPNIKMTPEEMRIIYGVLSRCDIRTQRFYTSLMEKWTRAGYIVATTPSTIRLEAPYGEGTTILTMLFPGVSPDMAKLVPGATARPPGIEIAWDVLKQRKGLPAAAIKKYFKAIQAIARIRKTQHWAIIQNPGDVRDEKAGKFLKAMKDLAASVRHEDVEPPTTSGPTTPANIDATFATCDANVRAIFETLIGGWQKVGGTVQCARPGRIYLKLKTRSHTTGNAARIPRNFNLAVLASPRGRRVANIQVTFRLGELGKAYAYLDCIPKVVEHFEKMVTALPGFEQKGTITRLMLDARFLKRHATLLIDGMKDLKRAEAAAR